jgi:hypothetical protein
MDTLIKKFASSTGRDLPEKMELDEAIALLKTFSASIKWENIYNPSSRDIVYISKILGIIDKMPLPERMVE